MGVRPGAHRRADSELISVVIPSWNAAQWIDDAISSVASQREVSVEIIVVDDGSTDDTGRVAMDSLRGLGSRCRRALVSSPQAGAANARKLGTQHSRGRYIHFLDADDILQPNTLNRMVAALESSGADVAYCDWCRWDPSVREPGSVVSQMLGNRPDIDLLAGAWWPPGALLWRRALVDQIADWHEELETNQDVRFILDAVSLGAAFVRTEHLGLYYRVHRMTSLSSRDPERFLIDSYENARQLHDEWRAACVLDAERRECLVSIYRHLARALVANGPVAHDVNGRLAALSKWGARPQ